MNRFMGITIPQSIAHTTAMSHKRDMKQIYHEISEQYFSLFVYFLHAPLSKHKRPPLQSVVAHENSFMSIHPLDSEAV